MVEKLNLFRGLIFWGSEFLSGEIYLTLEDIRQWAFNEGLIWDEDAQLITPEREKNLSKYFSPEDSLLILIHLYKDSQGNLNYLEYPFIPLKTLIKKQKEIELVYWQMKSTMVNPQGNIKEYGEVRFGFYFPEIDEEFASMSNGKVVCQKFFEMLQKLSKDYEFKKHKKGNLITLENGQTVKVPEEIIDIDVNGCLKARFFKKGRFFDVEFFVTPKA